MARPLPGDYGVFYQPYIDLTHGSEIAMILKESLEPLQKWLQNLPEEKNHFAYATGKWTLGQVLQHMIDTERIFSTRALCIGRGEQQHLPGFDENDYAREGTTLHKSLSKLIEELLTIRRASIFLYEDLSVLGALNKTGIASQNKVSVNALGFIMLGHVAHHQKIIQERYF